MPERRSGIAPGTVLRAGGGTYEVLLDDQTLIEATLRGRVKAAITGRGASGRRVREMEVRTGDRIVAGDRVRVGSQMDGPYTIESVDQRRTELARRAPGRNAHHAKVLIANIDQVAIVFAAAKPEPHLRMIDRFLVLAEMNHLGALVVINKSDLVPKSDAIARFAPYVSAGYPVLFTSAVTGEGLDALRAALCHRETALAGPSGAGKSSLLNAIEPGLELRVGEVSKAVGKGRHTTVTAVLVPLACGGFVADTPGLREIGFWGIDSSALDSSFPEFRPLLGLCRFAQSCTHTHEPECAIRDAVDAGDISRQRYESYAALVETE
jgi:ribosome biogenesis GTPase